MSILKDRRGDKDHAVSSEEAPREAVVNPKRPRSVGLPDVGHETPSSIESRINWVGMSAIEVSVLLDRDARSYLLPAKADAYVDLEDPTAKGIHMSRLYLEVTQRLGRQALSRELIRSTLQEVLNTHNDLSTSAHIAVRFDLPRSRMALLSGLKGHRNYPVTVIGALKQGAFKLTLGAEIMYSSTCPCSAALAGQAVEQQFRRQFDGGTLDFEKVALWLRKEAVSTATPHAQRSYARVRIVSEEENLVSTLDRMIDEVERGLGTPVQAAVKREDEQEFARLNAENLMFCEDAARRVKLAFENWGLPRDYAIEVEHVESLHPHNAVAKLTKGVQGGLVFLEG